MTKRRLFTIPLIPAIIIAVLIIASMGAYAAWMFSRTQGGTVMVKGSDFQLYSDAGCTTLLAPETILNFGDTRPSTPSNVLSIWGKNTGTDAEYPKISVANLGSGLLLKVNGTDVLTTGTNLFTQAGVSGIYATGFVINDAGGVTASQTIIHGAIATPGTPLYLIWTDGTNEICQVTAYDPSSLTIVRGAGAVAHALNATVSLGTGIIAPNLLDAGEVVQMALQVSVVNGAPIGVPDDFSIIVDVTSDF